MLDLTVSDSMVHDAGHTVTHSTLQTEQTDPRTCTSQPIVPDAPHLLGLRLQLFMIQGLGSQHMCPVHFKVDRYQVVI